MLTSRRGLQFINYGHYHNLLFEWSCSSCSSSVLIHAANMNSIGTHLGYPTISMILYPVRGQWPAVGPECYSVQSVCLSREINVSCIKKTRLARCKLNYLQFATANRRVAPQVVWSPLSVPPADDMNFSGIKSPSDECNGEEGASSQAVNG